MNAMSKTPRIFLAGPAWNAAERENLECIAQALAAAGEDVYLPFRDGLPNTETDDAWRRDVDLLLTECDAIVVDLHGRTPDEAAVYLAGLAYAAGLAVVLYKVDHRTVFYGTENSMVLGLSPDFRVVDKLRDLPASISRARAKPWT